MAEIGDEWDKAIHNLQCDRNAKKQDEIWNRFLRMYKYKNGVEWKPFTNAT